MSETPVFASKPTKTDCKQKFGNHNNASRDGYKNWICDIVLTFTRVILIVMVMKFMFFFCC